MLIATVDSSREARSDVAGCITWAPQGGGWWEARLCWAARFGEHGCALCGGLNSGLGAALACFLGDHVFGLACVFVVVGQVTRRRGGRWCTAQVSSFVGGKAPAQLWGGQRGGGLVMPVARLRAHRPCLVTRWACSAGGWQRWLSLEMDERMTPRVESSRTDLDLDTLTLRAVWFG